MDLKGKFRPIYEELTLPAETTPLDLFRALSTAYGDRGDVFFFRRSGESGKSSHHEPTQTLLAVDPFETIRITDGCARIKSLSGEFELEGNPFEILAKRIEAYRFDGPQEAPFSQSFFHGGALGYFAYDCIRHVEPSLKAHPGNLSQAKNQAYDAEFSFFGKLVLFDHVRNRAFLITDESVSLNEKLKLKETCLSARKAVSQSIPEPAPELAVEEMSPLLGKAQFIERVKKIKSHIQAGDIFQAVLSERFSVPFDGDSIDLFETLMQLSPSPYQFYFKSGERVFMGASPEMLARLSGAELETHPIAGTRPRGSTPEEERKFEAQLKRSEKEKSEHLMLVDLARNDMGRVSEPGSVHVPEFMELKKFAGVIHLVSRVIGKIRTSVHPVEALGSFFPAGTLSGAPKIRAMQILSELEPAPRGFYGGAVVIASLSGDLDSCIAIRSIQLKNGEAIVRAGAGIVADSRPESEYAEVQHKTRMARRALAIASRRSRLGSFVGNFVGNLEGAQS